MFLWFCFTPGINGNYLPENLMSILGIYLDLDTLCRNIVSYSLVILFLNSWGTVAKQCCVFTGKAAVI
jgi:hypothetical protein